MLDLVRFRVELRGIGGFVRVEDCVCERVGSKAECTPHIVDAFICVP